MAQLLTHGFALDLGAGSSAIVMARLKRRWCWRHAAAVAELRAAAAVAITGRSFQPHEQSILNTIENIVKREPATLPGQAVGLFGARAQIQNPRRQLGHWVSWAELGGGPGHQRRQQRLCGEVGQCNRMCLWVNSRAPCVLIGWLSMVVVELPAALIGSCTADLTCTYAGVSQSTPAQACSSSWAALRCLQCRVVGLLRGTACGHSPVCESLAQHEPLELRQLKASNNGSRLSDSLHTKQHCPILSGHHDFCSVKPICVSDTRGGYNQPGWHQSGDLAQASGLRKQSREAKSAVAVRTTIQNTPAAGCWSPATCSVVVLLQHCFCT